MRQYKVIDLFAGPGGLAEGFSSITGDTGERLFDIVLSVEKDEAAHRTLTLRAFARQFPVGELPQEYYAFSNDSITLSELQSTYEAEWKAAEAEARLIELGTSAGNRRVNKLIDQLIFEKAPDQEFIVIGGPPCQAYSLVGRARNKGVEGYSAKADVRHYLYLEYIKILKRVRPAVFVMENVKGMLSSNVAGRDIFRRVRSDLERAGGGSGSYELIALTPSSSDLFGDEGAYDDRDFVIRSERNGVPQARHRVIIVGVRRDVFERLPEEARRPTLPEESEVATVWDAISDLPALRSTLSCRDSLEAWVTATRDEMERVCSALRFAEQAPQVLKFAERSSAKFIAKFARRNLVLASHATGPTGIFGGSKALADFILDPKLTALRDHEARGHMQSDLGRYFFCANFAQALSRSPKAADFPRDLAPAHANWKSGKFADRFRVQCWDKPSTTIVSHIAKDGHYYIHPDPVQCRSLTPREAARLQTFPDNYIFRGNRTERFHQIGNAVPPYLAMQIGQVVSRLLDRSE